MNSRHGLVPARNTTFVSGLVKPRWGFGFAALAALASTGIQPAGAAATNSAPAAASQTNIVAIAPAEVAPQAEAAFASLQSIESALTADQIFSLCAVDLQGSAVPCILAEVTVFASCTV